MCGYRSINDHFPQFYSDYRVFERPDPRASPDSDRSLVPGGVGPHSSGARPGLGPPGEARGRPEGGAPWGFCATDIGELGLQHLISRPRPPPSTTLVEPQ